MEKTYIKHTYPSIKLINKYASNKNMDMKKWLNYKHKYYRYKKLENKYLNGFTLGEKKLDEHLFIGRELENLLKDIIKNK